MEAGHFDLGPTVHSQGHRIAAGCADLGCRSLDGTCQSHFAIGHRNFDGEAIQSWFLTQVVNFELFPNAQHSRSRSIDIAFRIDLAAKD